MQRVLFLCFALGVSGTLGFNRTRLKHVVHRQDTNPVSGTCPEGDTFVIPADPPGERNYAECSNIKHVVVKSTSHPGWVVYDRQNFFWMSSRIPYFLDSLKLSGNFAVQTDQRGGDIRGFDTLLLRNSSLMTRILFLGIMHLLVPSLIVSCVSRQRVAFPARLNFCSRTLDMLFSRSRISL